MLWNIHSTVFYSVGQMVEEKFGPGYRDMKSLSDTGLLGNGKDTVSGTQKP